MRQFLKFATVGGFNALISLATYALLLLAGVWYVVATILAYAIAMLVGYTLNRRWTFRAGAFQASTLVKYLCVQLAGLGMNVGLLVLFVELVGVAEFPAQLLTLPAVASFSFLASRRWVFRAARVV